MTFDSDFCRINFQGGHRDYTCKKLGIKWPPPEELDVYGFIFVRHRMSKLTDKEAKECDFVARGAEYNIRESVE